MRNAYKMLVWKPEGNTGRPRHTCEDNTKVNLKELGWEGLGLDLSDPASCCEHGNKYFSSIKGGEFVDCLSFVLPDLTIVIIFGEEYTLSRASLIHLTYPNIL
jgi:hypothetical protein